MTESEEGRRGTNPSSQTNTEGVSHCSIYGSEYIKLTHLLAKVESNFDRMIAILETGEEVR
ncbi:hypothetical protein [Methanocalculus sp. MC3]